MNIPSCYWVLGWPQAVLTVPPRSPYIRVVSLFSFLFSINLGYCLFGKYFLDDNGSFPMNK